MAGSFSCSDIDALCLISITAFIGPSSTRCFWWEKGRRKVGFSCGCHMHMNMYKKVVKPRWGSCFRYMYNNLISCIHLIPKKLIHDQSPSCILWGSSGFKWWSTIKIFAWEDDIIFCHSVISAYGSHFLKFLVSLWSQVFFSAAPQFPEVSADNCFAPSLAQSLKTFSPPKKETRISGPAQKAFPQITAPQL